MHHRFEQIEQYLRGLLPPEEAAAFEAELATDPELAELVRRHRLERQGLELLVERDLMAKMQAWDRETALQQPAPARRAALRPMTMLWRAAAVLAVALFGWWLLRLTRTGVPEAAPPVVHTKPGFRTKTPTIRRPALPPSPRKPIPETSPEPEEPSSGIAQEENPAPPPATVDYAALASEFYREGDFLPAKGSKGATGSASYDQAVDQFRKGKFDDVISQLTPALDFGPDALQRKELVAHALYKNRQWDAAIPYFREVIASRRQPYAQRAEWALALTLLQQLPAKKPLFDRVLSDILDNPQHLFYAQAQNLRARVQ